MQCCIILTGEFLSGSSVLPVNPTYFVFTNTFIYLSVIQVGSCNIKVFRNVYGAEWRCYIGVCYSHNLPVCWHTQVVCITGTCFYIRNMNLYPFHSSFLLCSLLPCTVFFVINPQCTIFLLLFLFHNFCLFGSAIISVVRFLHRLYLRHLSCTGLCLSPNKPCSCTVSVGMVGPSVQALLAQVVTLEIRYFFHQACWSLSRKGSFLLTKV